MKCAKHTLCRGILREEIGRVRLVVHCSPNKPTTNYIYLTNLPSADASARSLAAIERSRSISSSVLSSVAMFRDTRDEGAVLLVVVTMALHLDRAGWELTILRVEPHTADVDGATKPFVVTVPRPTMAVRDRAPVLSFIIVFYYDDVSYGA